MGEYEPQPQRESSVVKVTSVSPERETEIHEEFAHFFQEQPPEDFEREKSPEEAEIFRRLGPEIAEFVGQYGGTPLKIQPEHVHIIDEQKLAAQPQKFRDALAHMKGGARFVPELQSIYVYPENNNWGPYGKVRMAETVGHEMLHFNAYYSAMEKGGELRFRRGGWVMLSEKYGDLFSDIDEAVVEELTNRFSRDRLGNIPALHAQYEEREALIQRIFQSREKFYSDPALVETKQMPSGEYKTTISSYPYRKERKRLWEVIRGIREAMPEKFSSDEEVFTEFAHALFTGRVLNVARMVEGAHGRGAFRALGEATRGKKNAQAEIPPTLL